MSTDHPGPTRQLRRTIGLGQGIALYVSAVLGAGVLVLPGQAASLAGPASLLAWGFCCLLGVPLATMFAQLARAHPDAGGVSTYVARAFGRRAGGVAGWCYFVAGSVGQTIVPLTGGYYVAEAMGLGPGGAYAVAAAILAAAVAANCLGATFGARVQILLAVGVAIILVTATAAAVPAADVENMRPFAPQGIDGIGRAIVVLFFAFAGWEAVAHLAEEFRSSGRDLVRATAATVVIVTVLYLGVAAAVVLTGTYGSPAVDHTAIGRLLATTFGGGAATLAAVAAVVISLGTTNAFVAAVARLGYALARDGWLPAPLGRLDRNDVPVRGVLLVAGVAGGGLVLSVANRWGTEQLLVVPSTLVLVVYLAAAAAGVRLLTGAGRVCAVLTLVMTAGVLPSAAAQLAIPVAVAALALGYELTSRSSSKAG